MGEWKKMWPAWRSGGDASGRFQRRKVLPPELRMRAHVILDGGAPEALYHL